MAKTERKALDDAKQRAERRRVSKQARRRWRQRQREKARAVAEQKAGPVAEAFSEGQSAGTRRVRQGVVTSDKADKTVTVRVDLPRPHRIYKKVVRTSSTVHAHDEHNDARPGDTVRVVESRPHSRRKRWRLLQVVERAR
jgi:small subunit ribosomal protein S17